MLSQQDLADTIRNAVQSLLTPGWLMPEGGWGSWLGDVPNLWSTAEVLTLLKNSRLRDIGAFLPRPTVQPRNFETIIQEAVQYIESLGQDGAFKWSDAAEEPDPVSTAFALEVFLQEDNQTDQIRRCVQYIQEVQAPDRGWDRQVHAQFASSAISTAIVALALNRVKPVGPLTMLRGGPLANAKAFFLSRAIQQDDGTMAWSRAAALPEVRATAWVVYALHTIWHDDARAIPGAKWLKARQNENGSWGEGEAGDIEDTAMTIIALLSTGENPASQRIQRGIRYLNRELVRDPNGLFGYRAPNLRGAPGFENAVSTPATYYALLALLTYLDYAGEGGRPVFPPINWRSVLINGVPLLGFVAFTLMAAYYLFQLGSSNSALLFSILGLIGMIVSGTFLIRGRSRR